MSQRKIFLGTITAAAVIVFVLLVTIPEDITKLVTIPEDTTKSVVEEEKEWHKPTDIVEFSAVQYGNELTLSMSLGDIIPESLDEIPLSEDAVAFGYGWFGGNKAEEKDHIDKGLPHMIGYILSLNRNDTASANGWKLNAADIDTIFTKKFGVDYCLKLLDTNAVMVLANNTITVKTPPDTSPYLRAYFAQRAVSIELVPDDHVCHPGKIGAKIIDLKRIKIE